MILHLTVTDRLIVVLSEVEEPIIIVDVKNEAMKETMRVTKINKYSRNSFCN